MEIPKKKLDFIETLNYHDIKNAGSILGAVSNIVTNAKHKCGVDVKSEEIEVYIDTGYDDYDLSIRFALHCVTNKNYDTQREEYENWLNDEQLIDALKIVEESGKFVVTKK